MIEWKEGSVRECRFFDGELSAGSQADMDEMLRELFSFFSETLVGQGNGVDFDMVYIEVDCANGSVVAALTTVKKYKKGIADFVRVFIDELRDRYRQFADDPQYDYEEEFDEQIEEIERELGQKFRQILSAHLSELTNRCAESGFDLLQYRNESEEVLFNEHFDAA